MVLSPATYGRVHRIFDPEKKREPDAAEIVLINTFHIPKRAYEVRSLGLH